MPSPSLLNLILLAAVCIAAHGQQFPDTGTTAAENWEIFKANGGEEVDGTLSLAALFGSPELSEVGHLFGRQSQCPYPVMCSATSCCPAGTNCVSIKRYDVSSMPTPGDEPKTRKKKSQWFCKTDGGNSVQDLAAVLLIPIVGQISPTSAVLKRPRHAEVKLVRKLGPFAARRTSVNLDTSATRLAARGDAAGRANSTARVAVSP